MANFIAHFALQADDLDRAREFYRAVFGWHFEPWGPPDYYKVFTGDDNNPGVTEGGLSRRSDPGGEVRLNAYRCSISVESLKTTRREIEAHGGRVVSPVIELPEVGSVCQFEDPEGNVVAAVEYVAADRRAARSAGLIGEVRGSPRLYRVILPAGDMEGSVAFHRRLLEMRGERVSPGRHYFECGGVILAVVDPLADGDDREPHPNSDHLYLAVGDLEPYHRRAQELKALSPAMGKIETRPWGERSFYLRDPFGNPLCFVDESTLFLGHAGPVAANNTLVPAVAAGAKASSTERPQLVQVILNVPSMPEALGFYVDKLRFELVEPNIRDAAELASFVRLDTGGAFLALHVSARESKSHTRLSFLVNDFDAARSWMTDRGLKLSDTRRPAPGTRIADTTDPFGNLIHVEHHEPSRLAGLDIREGTTPSMLSHAKLISFVSTANPDRAREFYAASLGLEFVADDPFALVFRVSGRYLRIQKVERVAPAAGTVLGWEVEDISTMTKLLAGRGVLMGRFDGLNQDADGIATFANGDRVAWFKDPDGNILSLTQFSVP